MSRIFAMAIGVAVLAISALVLPSAAFAAPANDDFANATVLSGAAGSIHGSTIGATSEATEPSVPLFGLNRPSVWYRWTAPAVGSSVTFSLCDSGLYDTTIEIFSGSDLASLTAIASDDEGCGSSASVVTFPATGGTTYSVRVAGYGGQVGDFNLAYPANTVAVDTTPPVLTAPSSVFATATTASGALVPFTVTANDAHDGAVAVSCTPGSGTLFALGTTLTTCSAHDAAGNNATAQFPVTVTYSWSDVLAPLNANDSSIYKLNSTIPVKFRLTGFSSAITNATARITVTKLTSSVLGSDLEATQAITASSGDLFRYADGQYIYNLSTKGLAKGTYRIGIVLGDGVSRSVDVSLR